MAACGHLRLDPRSRPQEDVQVGRQRAHADGPAAGLRVRRGALLGGQRPARRGHRVRPGPAQDRPAAGGQDPQREPVRARHAAAGCRAAAAGRGRARHRADHRAAGPRAAAPAGRRGWHTARRRSTATTTPGRWSWPSSSSGCSATTTWNWSRPRAYGERGPAAAASAIATLRLALSAVLRLFAPFLPFVTEEVWSWWPDSRADAGRPASIHRAPWPAPAGLLAAAAGAGPRREHSDGAPDTQLDAASRPIAAIRKAKSQARLPMKAPVGQLTVTGPPSWLEALAAVLADVQAAGRVARVRLAAADGPAAGPDTTADGTAEAADGAALPATSARARAAAAGAAEPADGEPPGWRCRSCSEPAAAAG